MTCYISSVYNDRGGEYLTLQSSIVWGLDWSAIQRVSDSYWQQIPAGSAYPSRTDSTLLQGSGNVIYGHGRLPAALDPEC